MADVVLENVTCRYAGTPAPALTGVDLAIGDGELFALCGGPGSGKSTLLRLLAGLVAVTDGRILVGGRDISQGAGPLVAMVFQNYSIYPNLSVRENIGLPLRQQGVAKRALADRVETVAAMLDLTGLLSSQGVVLSAGQRIRVALARGLVREPEVLLMDEPLANLEPEIRAEVTDLLATAQRRHGITTVYATADPDEALALADRVGLLHDGELREVVAPADVDAAPTGQRVAGPDGSGRSRP